MLDLTQTAPTVEDAIGWLARAIGARMTTADRLRTAMAQRGRLRWRRLLHATVTDAAEGSHSLLELLYLHRVERAHGLPRSQRQARRADGRYDDVLYREYATRVELDGRATHPLHLRWRDHRRDNDAVEEGDRPLRYGLADVDRVPCAVALQVVRVLRRAGWTGTPQACGRPGCPLGASTLTAVD